MNIKEKEKLFETCEEMRAELEDNFELLHNKVEELEISDKILVPTGDEEEHIGIHGCELCIFEKPTVRGNSLAWSSMPSYDLLRLQKPLLELAECIKEDLFRKVAEFSIFVEEFENEVNNEQ